MVIAGMHPALAVAPTLYFFAQHAVGLMYHFPHSKLINQKLAVNYGTQLTHPCSTKEEVANAINPGIEKIAVIYPESREVVLRDAGPLKIIGILLNKLSGDGYLVTDLKALRGFYHRLAEVAINRGIELSVRDKPFGTCTRVLSGLLELDSSTLLSNTWRRLEDYLGTCDMILMFDSPTSACLSALSLGVPIVHVEFRPLADGEAALCPACIPSWNPDFCLLKITEFDTNADLLAEFKRNQQYAYLRGISSGRSLRSILGAKAGP
jgi:hypothetical protein